jgi:predicted HAD superfamily hydrolase
LARWSGTQRADREPSASRNVTDVARTCSFDVFDTAITRPWIRPPDLFYAVAAEAWQGGLWRQPPEAFRSARVAAEAQARQRSAADEVSLADIYDVLATAVGWSAEQRRAVERIEREVELESCIPIARTRQSVAAVTSGDTPPLFISDTYLDADTIARMLTQCGYNVVSTRLFVSSAHGRTKWSGRLFQDVLADLQLAPAGLRHVGDNPVSDQRAPRRLGIEVVPFRDGAANHYEATFAAQRQGAPVLTSAIAGSARATRLSRHDRDERQQTIWDTSADVSGPLLTGYVLWLLGRAVAQGRRRLYFFARDGQILKRIAEQFVTWYGLDIELRYLHVSRRALFLASLDAVDAHALDWFVEDGEGKTLADILARVDLDFDQIADRVTRSLRPDTQLSRADLDALAGILGDAAVAPAIVAAARRRRELVVDYLRQEGLLDGTPFAIVDIGWRGRLQRALHAILVTGGLLADTALVGYYLGMFTQLADMPWGLIETCLPAGSGYLASLLEFFTAADHGSTFGYARVGSRIEPVFDTASENAAAKADIRLQQDGIVAFAANLRRALRRPMVDPATLADAVMAAGASAMERLAYRPSAAEAEVFGAVQHSPDQAHLDAHDIAPRVGPGTVMLAALGHLGPLRRVGDWPEASLRRSVCHPCVGSVVLELLGVRRRAAGLVRRLRRGVRRPAGASLPVAAVPLERRN